MFAIEKLICFIATVLVSSALYTYIEIKLRLPVIYSVRMLHNIRLGAITVIACVIALASAISFSNGLPWRIPPAPAQIAEQLSNPGEFHRTNYGGAGTPYSGHLSSQPTEAVKKSKSIMLMGDSHMRHYFTGLTPLLNAGEYESFVSIISCLSTPGLIRNTPGQDWDQLCSDNLQSAITFAKKNKAQVMVVAFFWDFQINSALVKRTGEKVKFEDVAHSLEILAAMVAPTKILLIADVPGAGLGDPTACFTRPNIFGLECRHGQGTTLKKV
jgi:hypothetical protein